MLQNTFKEIFAGVASCRSNRLNSPWIERYPMRVLPASDEMGAYVKRAFLGLIAVAIALSSAGIARAKPFLGAYIWGGLAAPAEGRSALAQSVAIPLAAGFDTIRVAISPSAMKSYGLQPRCMGATSLGCAADTLFADPIWADPRLKRLILTAQDYTCFTDAACLTPDGFERNKAATLAEHNALLDILWAKFGIRGVEVVLSNWEGDNLILCGSAFRFFKRADFSAKCRSSWPSTQTVPQRAQEFLRWIALRDEAIRVTRVRHPGFRIVQAPEFDRLVGTGASCGLTWCGDAAASVFGQIASAGGRDWCSFSSYGAQSGPDGRFLAASKMILTKCRNLIIGETGYDLNRHSPADARQLYQALDQIGKLNGIAGIVPWVAFDPPAASTRYGLWTADGRTASLANLGPLLHLLPEH